MSNSYYSSAHSVSCCSFLCLLLSAESATSATSAERPPLGTGVQPLPVVGRYHHLAYGLLILD